MSVSEYATAYKKGSHLLGNAEPHALNRYFICIDLEDFFPNISINRVTKIFRLIGYSQRPASILSRLCCCDSKLPQGGITSPAISNLVASKLDRRIAGFTSRRNITYTRYADDLTFSSNNQILLHKSLKIIKNIIRSEHFFINEDKLKCAGPRRRCIVTGLIKNSKDPKFAVGKYKKRIIRAAMFNMMNNKVGCHEKYNNEASINGWLSFLKGVDAESYAQMKSYWDKLQQNFQSKS